MRIHLFEAGDDDIGAEQGHGGRGGLVWCCFYASEFEASREWRM
jgi:hypothetical protein